MQKSEISMINNLFVCSSTTSKQTNTLKRLLSRMIGSSGMAVFNV